MKMIKQNTKTKTTRSKKMPKYKNNDDSEIFIQKIISLLLLILCEFQQISNNTELLHQTAPGSVPFSRPLPLVVGHLQNPDNVTFNSFVADSSELQMIKCVKTLDNPLFFLSIGMKMLFHIFHMNVVYTKNLETIFNNCRSSIYLYFEYLEQMKKTDSLHCLNYLDAIQFVYNKSIYKNHERKPDESTPKYNISKLIKITNIIYILLWWENNKLDRNCFSIEIFEKLLYYTKAPQNGKAVQGCDPTGHRPTSSTLFSSDYDTFFNKIDEYEEKLISFQQNTEVDTNEYMKYIHSLL